MPTAAAAYYNKDTFIFIFAMSLSVLNSYTLSLNTREMLLLGFFKLDPYISHKDKEHLESLRIEPRNFNLNLFDQLNALGLVEYDTATGIAFQSADQWEVKLTEAGINLICAVKNLETETLAFSECKKPGE